MATLRDIAEEAGVSMMTVSNVVNGKTSKVSQKTREKVEELLRKHHYVQNASARSLASANSNIIAIILRNIPGENALSSPHNAQLVGAIVQHLQSLGYYAMITLVESCASITTSIRTWNAQGAIFLGMFDEEIEQIYSLSSIPMVFIDSYSRLRRLSNVGIDDYKGGTLAAEYFLRMGHRHLAFIGPPDYDNGVIQHRLRGFTRALGNHGVSFLEAHRITLTSPTEPDQIEEGVERLLALQGEITGVFVTSDQLATSLISRLHACGLRIPADLSLIGFDDMPCGTQIYPTLTTIGQDLSLKARLAVDILSGLLQAPDSFAESRVLDVRLIERESVAQIG